MDREEITSENSSPAKSKAQVIIVYLCFLLAFFAAMWWVNWMLHLVFKGVERDLLSNAKETAQAVFWGLFTLWLLPVSSKWMEANSYKKYGK